jgi:hypothetical protein
MAANPTLKVKARMLAPARAVAPACIKALRTSSVASPKLSIRDWFHSQAADFNFGPGYIAPSPFFMCRSI